MTEPTLGPIARAGAGLAQPPRVSFEFSYRRDPQIFHSEKLAV